MKIESRTTPKYRNLSQMSAGFARFLADGSVSSTAECYIPSLVDQLIHEQAADCRILETDGRWFGVTFPEDKALCGESIRQLVLAGVYPARLWA